MSTVRQIAKKTGVSTATVSRVLNNHPSVSREIRNRVLQEADLTSYSGGPSKQAQNLAVLYFSEMWLSSGFDAAVLEGISKGMADSTYGLLILDVQQSRERGESFRQYFRRMGIAGAVVRVNSRTDHVCEELASEGLHTVVVGERFQSQGVSFVYSESKATSTEAIEHLIGLGHERIAISLNVIPDLDHEDRLQGYRDALEQAGIEFDPKLVMNTPAQRENGAALMKRIASMPEPPTAIYITDPIVVLGAMKEANRSGIRVPEDLSIIGFDDTDFRNMSAPGYTAVCQDSNALGQTAVTVLLESIKNPDQPSVHQTLPTWFEVQDTTGVPHTESASSDRSVPMMKQKRGGL